jgi:hypothetical protein
MLRGLPPGRLGAGDPLLRLLRPAADLRSAVGPLLLPRLQFIEARGLRACVKIPFSRAPAPVLLDYHILLVTRHARGRKVQRFKAGAVYRAGSLDWGPGCPRAGFGAAALLQAVRFSAWPALAYVLVPVCT